MYQNKERRMHATDAGECDVYLEGAGCGFRAVYRNSPDESQIIT
jgi:hypothetical protein